MALVTEVIEPGQPNRSSEDSIHGSPFISGLEQHLTSFECNDLTPISQETQGSGACRSQGQGGTEAQTDIIGR